MPTAKGVHGMFLSRALGYVSHLVYCLRTAFEASGSIEGFSSVLHDAIQRFIRTPAQTRERPNARGHKCNLIKDIPSHG